MAEETDQAKRTGKSEGAGRPEAVGELPKVDFSTLVLSLGTTALFQMGDVPDPQTGEAGQGDPVAVQQTIDTLEMLREKTLGNLDDEERNLIDSLLYEVRMRFVETQR